MNIAAPLAKNAAFGDIDEVQFHFNRFAGANFGVALFQPYYEGDTSSLSPLFLWSLACRALIDGEDSEGVLEAQRRQLEEFVGPTTYLGENVQERVREHIEHMLSHAWAAWLPYLLFSPARQRHAIWDTWTACFPCTSPEQRMLRTLLFELLANDRAELLYTSEGLESKFASASPAEAAALRMGKLVRGFLDGEEHSEAKEILERWRTSLHTVLRTLQQAQKVVRGFAPQDPDFENLVLAILAVAEWRLQPEIWRIHSFIESCGELPDERMTTNQLVLSGALFGLLEGYRHLGSGIADREWRQHLTRHALALSLKFATGANQETGAFYLSPTGEPDALPPPLRIRQVQRKMVCASEWRPEGVKSSTEDTLNFELQLADMAPSFQLTLVHQTSNEHEVTNNMPSERAESPI